MRSLLIFICYFQLYARALVARTARLCRWAQRSDDPGLRRLRRGLSREECLREEWNQFADDVFGAGRIALAVRERLDAVWAACRVVERSKEEMEPPAHVSP